MTAQDTPSTNPANDEEAHQDSLANPKPLTPSIPIKFDDISANEEKLSALVPEIGDAHRWYDHPYRFLSFLQSSWRRKIFPRAWLLRLNRASNFFLAFHQHDRWKATPRDKPLDNLIIPVSEEVRQGGLWIIEFFPPSYSTVLTRALRKNGWGKNDYFRMLEGTNAEQIAEARRNHGYQWFRIGTVRSPKSRYWLFDAHEENLPEEFDSIELTALQLGQSLTAVIAFVRFSKQGTVALNRIWKAEHEPFFKWRGLRRPEVENRYFSAMRATQSERKRLHNLARTWFKEKCGGYFADTDEGQPIIDFTVFTEFDPTAEKTSRNSNEFLRSFGIERQIHYKYVSEQVPGAVFLHGDPLRKTEGALQNSWAVVGQYKTLSLSNEESNYEEPPSVIALAGTKDWAVQDFLLRIGVRQYIKQLRATFSAARDTARTKHGRFSPRQVEQLRHEWLTTSLDLPAVARDTALLSKWHRIDVNAVPLSNDFDPPEGFSLIERFEEERSSAFEELLQEDLAYRDVLSTAASLGASAAEARLSRRSMTVAGASLIVAFVTLMATVDVSQIWSQTYEWLVGLLTSS